MKCNYKSGLILIGATLLSCQVGIFAQAGTPIDDQATVETLLPAMRTYDAKLAYVLVWRNDSRSSTRIPTLFENDLEGIYRD